MGTARDAKHRLSENDALPESQNHTSVARPIEFKQPRKFPRVPTYAVGVVPERRNCPRAWLNLPLRLIEVASQTDSAPVSLVTKNISSSGIFFLSPRHIEPGTSIELEVALIERPLGHGSVRMSTAAHVVRIEASETPGWHGVAASFDDIEFERDESLPLQLIRR
jgi:hypothetical protein